MTYYLMFYLTIIKFSNIFFMFSYTSAFICSVSPYVLAYIFIVVITKFKKFNNEIQ